MRKQGGIAAALFAASLGLAATQAAGAGPGLFTFTYYPERGIYHDSERGIWYWNDGKSWNSGTELPTAFQQYTAGGVTLELESKTPYEHQARVEAKHGKPRRYEDSREANAVKKEAAKRK